MKLEDIDYEDDLKITDFENFFDVYEIDDKYRYNLNKNLYLNIGSSNLLEYELHTSAHWSLISYKLYGTTRLAWLLMKINNVTLAGTYVKMQPGTKIKYISKDNVKAVVKALD